MGIAVIDRVAGEQVGAVAVALFIFARDAKHQIFAGDRSPERAFERPRVIIAVSGTGIAAELGGWPRGDDIDDAAGRTAAICRALRSAQHFDLLDVVKAAELRRRAADHRAILQEGHGAVGAKVDAGEADAANEGAVDAELIADRDIGHRRGEIASVFDTARADVAGTENRNRAPCIFQRLAGLGCRYDDGTILAGLGAAIARGLLGERWRRDGNRSRGSRRQQ